MNSTKDDLTKSIEVKNEDENKRRAKKWMNRSHAVRSFDDSLDMLVPYLEFPPFNLILGFTKSTLRLLSRGFQLRARHFDPSIVEPKKIAKGINFLTATSFVTSVMGFSALAAGGAATGAALAPISLFVYACVSGANELLGLFKSGYQFYRTLRQKEPKETHGLRIAKKATDILYNLANTAFKFLLAAVAFTAIANPLGLVISGTLLAGLALATFMVGGFSYWLKNKLGKRLKAKEDTLFKDKGKPTLGKKPRPEKKVKAMVKPEQGILPTFEKGSLPNPDLTWKKADINVKALKGRIQEIGREHGLNFSYLSDANSENSFKVIRKIDEGQKEIAQIHCRKQEVEYQFTKQEDQTKPDHDHVTELRALLLSIKRSNPDTLVLKEGHAKEVLLIYKTALEVGLTLITLDPATQKRLSQLHPQELDELVKKHERLLNPVQEEDQAHSEAGEESEDDFESELNLESRHESSDLASPDLASQDLASPNRASTKLASPKKRKK